MAKIVVTRIVIMIPDDIVYKSPFEKDTPEVVGPALNQPPMSHSLVINVGHKATEDLR